MALTKFKEEQVSSKKNNGLVVASMDLQKVLSTPHNDSMLLYYSRKYSMYNFSIYDSSTRDCYCYIWGESDGNKGSNEIATCLFDFLQNTDKRNVQNVSLYSDNCFGQNKNRTVMSAVQLFLDKSEHVEQVSLSFLVPGHTYMTVDSCHAVIERAVKKKIVWAPSEWSTIIRNARTNPFPYYVKEMQYNDFLNFKKIINGKAFTKTVDNDTIKISDTRKIMFNKNSKFVHFVYSLSPDATVFKAKFEIKTNVERAYLENLPINKKKYIDLTNLCKNGVIPKSYQNEYYSLKSNDKVADVIESEEECT